MIAAKAPDRPPRGRGRVRLVLVVTAALAVIVVALTLLTMRESSAGSVAIETVRERTRSVLATTSDRLADDGRSLKVSWSAVPAPSGPGHMVVARLELPPAQSVEEARFVVVDEQITPQNALARSLLPDVARG